MLVRSRLVVLVMAGLLLVAGPGPALADDGPNADLKPFQEQVSKLVTKHYPKAKITVKDQTISFAFNTRKFMIHEPLLTGEWQDAYEMTGPQKGGIVGEIELRSGRYGGQAVVPQSFDMRYFTLHLLAPYSPKTKCHVYVHLYCPRDVPKGFVEEFEKLMNGFDKHIEVKGK